MKYKELFTIDSGIFSIIGYSYTADNYQLTSSQLDAMFYGMYADKTLSTMVTDNISETTNALTEDFKTFLKTFFSIEFSRRWNHLIGRMLLDYNPIENVDYTITDNGKTGAKSTKDENTKTYGYDSSEGGDAENVSTTNDATRTNENTRTIKGRQVANATKYLREDIDAHNTHIAKTICDDVCSYLCLAVYE